MTKEEIIGGLKNALDRGESLERAKQSFVNAGYSQDEVNEAALHLSGSDTAGSNLLKKNTVLLEDITAFSPMPLPQKASEQFKPLPTTAKPSRKKSMIRIALVGVAIAILLLILNLIRELLNIKLG